MSTDVSKRLLTFGSAARIDQFHVALDEWRGHRLLGTGAGTYAQYWMAARSNAGKVLDVHNLYLETLAELGLVGLVILVGALLVPLAGAVRSRHLPLVAIAAGAYATWLAHAAYDWDWELPAVTLPALLCAGSILAAGRAGGRVPIARRQSLLLAAALAVGVVGTLALVENRALVQSADHAQRGDYKEALALARRARWLMPWSSDPWAQVAGIRIQQGRRIDAVDAYRHAVAKDPDDWTLWLGLAAQSRGKERAQAIVRLRALSPSVAAAFVAPGTSAG